MVIVSACGSDEVSGPTDAELLAAIEERTLTPAEVASKLETADLLCSLDNDVLLRIWRQLEPDQMAFQEFVFTRRCPEREPELSAGTTTTTRVVSTMTTTTGPTTTTTTRPRRPSTSRPPLRATTSSAG